jgi:hypothetical protein
LANLVDPSEPVESGLKTKNGSFQMRSSWSSRLSVATLVESTLRFVCADALGGGGAGDSRVKSSCAELINRLPTASNRLSVTLVSADTGHEARSKRVPLIIISTESRDTLYEPHHSISSQNTSFRLRRITLTRVRLSFASPHFKKSERAPNCSCQVAQLFCFRRSTTRNNERFSN